MVTSVILALFVSVVFAFLSMLSVRSAIINQVDSQSKSAFSLQLSKAQSVLDPESMEESLSASLYQSTINDLVTRLQNEGDSNLVSVYAAPADDASFIIPISTDPSYIPLISQDLMERVQGSAVGQVFSQPINVALSKSTSIPGRVYAATIPVNDSQDIILFCFYSYEQQQNFLIHIQLNLFLLCLLISLLIGIISFSITSTITTPVRQAAAAAESLAHGNLAVRLGVTSHDEIGVLQQSLNDMAESLIGQIKQLEAMTTMQKQFVSDVSHELRTPITTIRMAADRLMRMNDQFDPATRRTVVLLDDQITRFQDLLLDLLEISRNDAGKSQINAAKVNVCDSAHDMIMTLSQLAEANDVDISVSIPDKPIMLYADSTRLDRILKNVLSNAIDFSQHSRVEFCVLSNTTYVVISVRDYGIGMSAEDVAHIFDRFWRKDASRSRLTGGTGLGMSICRDDVRLHHGEIYVHSTLGEGTWFLIALPLDMHITDSVVRTDLPLYFTGEVDDFSVVCGDKNLAIVSTKSVSINVSASAKVNVRDYENRVEAAQAGEES